MKKTRKIKYHIVNGQKVIRERDAFMSQLFWERKHPHDLAIYRHIGSGPWDIEPLPMNEIMTPANAWIEGYKQAVRDQKKLMRQEYEPVD